MLSHSVWLAPNPLHCRLHLLPASIQYSSNFVKLATSIARKDPAWLALPGPEWSLFETGADLFTFKNPNIPTRPDGNWVKHHWLVNWYCFHKTIVSIPPLEGRCHGTPKSIIGQHGATIPRYSKRERTAHHTAQKPHGDLNISQHQPVSKQGWQTPPLAIYDARGLDLTKGVRMWNHSLTQFSKQQFTRLEN